MRHVVRKINQARKIYPAYLKQELFSIPTPVLVTLGITNKCNLRCDYCFVGLDNRVGMELDTPQILDIVDQFAELGAVEINLQGGEPSLHKDIDVIINHIVNKGMVCSMASNGAGFLKSTKKFKRLNGDVGISIDGQKELTDKHRGDGAYDDAIKALAALKRDGINRRIHGVVSLETHIEDIDHVVNLAVEHECSINFVYALESGNNEITTYDEKGFPASVSILLHHIKELKKRGFPIVSKDAAINQVLNWPFGAQDILLKSDMTAEKKNLLKENNIPKCKWGELAVFVNTDEKLYLCPRAFDRDGYSVSFKGKSIREAYLELVKSRPCYMCGQMGDLSYSFNLLDKDNLATWLKF